MNEGRKEIKREKRICKLCSRTDIHKKRQKNLKIQKKKKGKERKTKLKRLYLSLTFQNPDEITVSFKKIQ